MHLIVAFASPASDAGREALARLRTPALDAWLARGAVIARDDRSDEWSPTTPHERAFARALGWPSDGPLPWAARQGRADGIDVGHQAWGLLTPVHWRVGSDAIHLADPASLSLAEADSRALLDTLRPWFESEGFVLAWGAPLRWYLSHPSLAALTTASVDRVIGRNIDRWLPAQAEARLLRRLQNEVQMLLHAHPLNEARAQAGLLPVNSFWLSGCGVAQPEAAHDAQLDERLRSPALAEDWDAWSSAFDALDASWPSSLTRLTLCGERGSVTIAPAEPSSLWQRLARPFATARSARDHLVDL